MEVVIGIVVMGLFVLYVIKKGKNRKKQPKNIYEEQFWAERQEEYDNVSIVDASDEDDD